MYELRPWLALMLQRRKRLWLGVLLMFLTFASVTGLLALSGWFITATALTGILWASGQRFIFDVYLPGGGIRFFALARTVGRYVERVYNHDTVLRLLADLRGDHFAALAQLDGAVLSRWRAAQWLNRLTADIDTLDTLYLRLLAPPLVALLGILLVGLVVAFFHLGLAAVLAAGLSVLLLLVTLGMAAWGMQLSDRRVELLDAVRLRSVEQLQGLAELKAAGTLGLHQQCLLNNSAKLLKQEQALQWRIAVGQGVTTFGVLLAMLSGLYAGMQLFQRDVLSGPVVVMIVLALMALGEAMAGLAPAFARAGGTRAAARRLNQQTAMRAQITDPVQPQAMPDSLAITWDRVVPTYAAFAPLSLHLPAGQRLVVIGPSGCGKSTLAALAARLIDPGQGEVRVGDVSLRCLPLHKWREHVGYLTQETELLHDSIAANLRLARPDATAAQLWAALELVDLADWIEELPDQMATWVGESGRQFSGGQARRLALARVILKDAPLVILDEPFRGLDVPTLERIRPGLERWLDGRTVLMLGHDPRGLLRADRVISWDQLVRA